MPGERRGWGQQYRSHWDPEYGNQCGSYRTGAVSGIGSGLVTLTDYYATNLSFPGGKNGERRGISGGIPADSDGKSQIMIATLEFLPKRRSGTRGQGACGRLVDKHTFLGLIRIDYKSIQTGDQGYYEQIPEDMTLQLHILYIRRGIAKERTRKFQEFHRAER